MYFEIVPWVIIIGSIIFFGIKRYKDSKKEDFEDRKN